LIGGDGLPGSRGQQVEEFLNGTREYDVVSMEGLWRHLVETMHLQETVASADLAVCFLGRQTQSFAYILGVVHGTFVPLISVAIDDSFPHNPQIPSEYQPRPLEVLDDVHAVRGLLGTEIDLYEQDFLEIDDQEEVDRYARQLIELRGRYGEGTRDFVKEVVMGDKYVAGQAGAMGPNAHAHDITFNQMWNQLGGGIDLSELASELETLRATLKDQATAPDHDLAVGEVAAAEIAAKGGDGPKALEHLKKAGGWALGVATAIGTTVAAAAIKVALGV
jgi:hypothetical protein